jgi:hypothetical protein
MFLRKGLNHKIMEHYLAIKSARMDRNIDIIDYIEMVLKNLDLTKYFRNVI